MVDIPGNSTTTSVVSVGSTTNGSVEVGGDHDWFKISLTAGQIIQVTMNGLGLSALEDPYLRIRDSSGAVIFENDDHGGSRNAFVAFQASYSGVYYIDAAAWDNDPPEYNYTGDYELKVEPWQEPPVATIDQIANQLTHGYWDGDSHHFAVTQGGTISVNLIGLTNAGQSLAREALRQWSDIIGVSFTEVGTGGQIIFDDNEDGASTGPVWADGIMSSAHVNIAASWLRDYGTTVGTYSFQTYVHEIGHALGLGHAGNYNGDATFPYDARFLNDATPMSVMSYFSPVENTYFSGLNFSDSSIGTPMLADIVAMSQLYGLSTTTRLGNTTYGFNSTAGNSIYNANLYPAIAYTVFDSGGIDTLDYSGFSQSQLIDLTSGAFSNTGGRIGNVTIAIGTLIENATGGSGDDTLIGNSADNLLNGGGGTDTVSYARASAGVTVNLGLAGAQNTIGAGTDTLIGFETLIGSDFGDRLTAGAGNSTVRGGGGNDTLVATGDGDTLFGDAGDDTFINGAGVDQFSGGDGFDTVDYSAASAVTGATGGDTFDSIERIIGSSFDDQLSNAAVVIGGAGNDTYLVRRASDQVVEAAGQGADLVKSYIDYILPENVENLTLLASSNSDPFAGAAVPTGPPPPNPINGSGNSLDNIITGNLSANLLSGLMGSDTLTGGGGNDTFRDSLEAHNGDTITDFSANDRLIFTNADLSTFAFSLSGTKLTYAGDFSLNFGSVLNGQLTARAAAGGGVELILTPMQFANPALALTNFGAAPGAGGWSSDDRYPRLLGDVNGDGRADIVGFGESGAYVSLGTSTGSFAGMTLATTSFGAGAGAGSWSSNDLYVRHLADVNGDGKADIVGFGNHGAYVSLGNADGSFGTITLVSTDYGAAASAGGWSANDRYPRMLADVNGDGKIDIVGFGEAGVYVSLATAGGSFAPATLATTAFGAAASAGGWSSDDQYPRHLADVNGDGRADVVGFGHAGVYVSLANANGTFDAATFSLGGFGAGAGAGGWTSDDRYPRELADVNGDHKIDVIGFGNGGVYIALGKGDGTFDPIKQDLNFFGLQPGAGGWASDDLYPRHLADVNHDGAADIVGFASNGVYVALSTVDILT